MNYLSYYFSTKKTFLLSIIFILLGIRYYFDVLRGYDFLLYNLFLYGLIFFSVDYSKEKDSLPYLIILSILTIFNPNAVRLCLIMLICFLSRDVDIVKISKVNCFIGIFIIVSLFYLLNIGVLEDESYIAYNVGDTIRERHSLGVGYNRFSLIVYSLIINLYLFLYRKLNTFIVPFICFSLAYYCYLETGSNSAFIAVVSLTFYHFIFNYKISRKLLSKKIILYNIPFLFLFVTVLVAFLYPYLGNINQALTNRPAFTYSFFNQISVFDLLLGNKSNMSSKEYYVDSSHIHLLFEGGIVFYIFFYRLYIKAVKYYLYRQRKTFYTDHIAFLPVVFSMLTFGLTECIVIEISLIPNAIFWVYISFMASQYDRNRDKINRLID